MTLLYTALANLAVLAAIFVPLERVFSARAQRIFRPQLVLDGCFFLGQYLVTTVAILAVLRALTPLHSQLLSSSSPVLQVVAAVVAGDFVVYWFHRACHRFDVLWRFHAVHHTSEHLDWVAAHREHPFDGIVTAALMNLPAIVLGVRPELLAGVAIFRACWAIFVHSNARVPLGPLRYLLGAPELHHWHHARENVGHNYANLAPYWDVVFGTHHCPEADEQYELGIAEEYPRSYPALLVWPFQRLVWSGGVLFGSGTGAAGPPPRVASTVAPKVYAVIDNEPYAYPSTSTSAGLPAAAHSPAK